jgi:hypothetical protein
MNALKQIESAESTPEELLVFLDTQLAAQRSQRAKPGRNRAIMLVCGVLFIVLGAGIALLVLDQMLVDLRQSDRLPVSAHSAAARNF